MTQHKLSTVVRRASPFANVIDIEGDITSFSEGSLMDAYAEATQGNVRTIIFNFSGLGYMNSLGIGMLVALLVRARRDNKNIVGYGLSDHYKKIFELTRMDQVIPVFETEVVALAKAERMDLPEREY